MKKFYFFSGLLLFGLAFSASAVSVFDITYPISELDNCASQAECKVYCDDLSHKDACLAFAEKYGFVAKEKVEVAKKLPPEGPGGCSGAESCREYCSDPEHENECLAFAEKYGLKARGAEGQDVSAQARLIKEEGGPGNCQSQKECRAYCENPAHQGECIAFAEKHDLIDKKELAMAKKVMEQGGPGGCRTEKECKAFCDKPENLEVCLAFAEEHGMIDKEEAARARKMANKPGPGGCRGAACKDYCDGPDHFEECIAFAEENNLMSKEELEKAKQLGNKPGPGGCRGRQQCDDFCRQPVNQETCFQFAVENNLIPPEEIERAKKMKRIAEESGPGGCRGERECRAYCENPEHSDECLNFAKEKGLIDEREIKMMERGRELQKKVMEVGGPGGCRGERECRAYCENPEHVEECLAFAVEHGGVRNDEAKMMLEKFAQASAGLPTRRPGEPRGFPGQRDDGPRPPMMPPRDFEMEFEKRFERFEQFRELEGQFRKPPEMMREMQGPGGCQGPDECIKYCSDPEHRDECARFNPSVGAPPPGEIFKQVEPGSASGFRPDLEKMLPLPYQTSSDALRAPFTHPPSGGMIKSPIGAEGNYPMPAEGTVCTQEYRPVCGANNRTYPNECFAKRDNVSVVKSGPCEALNPPAGGPDGMMPPPDFQKPSYYPSGGLPAQAGENFVPQYQPPPPMPAPEPYAPPQSRRGTSSFLSNLLQVFLNAFRFR